MDYLDLASGVLKFPKFPGCHTIVNRKCECTRGFGTVPHGASIIDRLRVSFV